MFGFSTGWNIRRHDRAADALDEIQGLGFEKIELAGLTESQAREVVALQERDAAPAIVSIHTYCPLPPLNRQASFGDLLDLASLDPTERRQAVKYAKRTIDFAAELGAQTVIMHLGSVDVEYTPMTLIMDQWETFFDEKWVETHSGVVDEKHGGKPATEVLTEDEFEALKDWTIDHAADSEQPMTCG